LISSVSSLIRLSLLWVRELIAVVALRLAALASLTFSTTSAVWTWLASLIASPVSLSISSDGFDVPNEATLSALSFISCKLFGLSALLNPLPILLKNLPKPFFIPLDSPLALPEVSPTVSLASFIFVDTSLLLFSSTLSLAFLFSC